MGDKKRMGDTGDKVILYAAQADAVLKAIERDGRCFSREEYVRRKYGESGPIFLTVYRWFVKEAAKLVPKPEGAEFPYWSFMNLYSLDQSAGTRTLTVQAVQVHEGPVGKFRPLRPGNQLHGLLHKPFVHSQENGTAFPIFPADIFLPRKTAAVPLYGL